MTRASSGARAPRRGPPTGSRGGTRPPAAADLGRGRRHAVLLGEKRAAEHERPGPRRVGELLPEGPAPAVRTAKEASQRRLRPGDQTSRGRPATASPASSAAGSGSAGTRAAVLLGDEADDRHADDPRGRRPCERVRDDPRASFGSVHAAMAATPAVRIIEIDPHRNLRQREQRERRRGRSPASRRRAARSLRRAAPAAVSTEQPPRDERSDDGERRSEIRSCPAAAIDTPKSSATSLRIGDRTSTPAWLATNARKSDERRRREDVARRPARCASGRKGELRRHVVHPRR